MIIVVQLSPSHTIATKDMQKSHIYLLQSPIAILKNIASFTLLQTVRQNAVY
jgi:hypothetical protein